MNEEERLTLLSIQELVEMATHAMRLALVSTKPLDDDCGGEDHITKAWYHLAELNKQLDE
jgi:hypothetical protein